MAHAAVYRVGNDPGCSHATLAAAMATAASNDQDANTIYLPAGTLAALPAPLLIDGRSLQLIGGFADCSAAAPSGRTAIAGPAGVLHVRGATAVPFAVTLRGLDLTAQSARVLDHDGTAALRLDDTTVSGGRAGPQDGDQFGGGIRVRGTNATLILGAGTRVFDNDAVAGGGGVYCFGAHLQLESGSSIDTNTSYDGGGVYLDGCTFNDASGGAPRPSAGNFGITNNAALHSGGGVYAVNGSALQILGTADLTLVAGNIATNGGGVYLAGSSSTTILVNSSVENNSASSVGGGLYVRDHANLQMARDTAGCPGERFCSQLHENRAARGSAIAVDGAARALILQTDIRHNPVTGNAGGAAIDVRGADNTANPPSPSYVLLESVMLLNHAPAPATFAAQGAWLRAALVSTLNNNAAFVLGDGGRISTYSSVIQDTVFVMPPSGNATRFADCITAKEIASIPPGLDGIEALDNPAALYKSPDTGDLRQRPRARSIDRCDTFFYTPTTRDVFGQLRGQDVPSVHWSPSFGNIDRGATEAPWLFADDFDE